MTDTPTEPTPAEAPAEQPQVNPFVGNEEAFCRSLGIDPNLVVSGSIDIEFRQGGVPHIMFKAVQAVTPQALGMAFLAAAPAEPVPQSPPLSLAPPPQDHLPPAKPGPRRKPTRKATAKKAAPKAGK